MRLAAIVAGIAGAGALAALGFVAWLVSHPEVAPVEVPEPRSLDPAAVKRGQALAAFGNCAGCHSAPGGALYAGGLPLATPFGTIRTTNITPDPDTGIGRWSEAAFRRAMREGIDREGSFLYPAFPYDHYTKVSDEDIRALYAFLMTQRPARTSVAANDLAFPFGIRSLVAGWNLLFLDAGPFRPDPSQSEKWNRGAYLVEGLGHCGSCHTPRNVVGAERPDQALRGSMVDGWWAPSLRSVEAGRAPWTEDAIVNYLIDGWDEQHGVAAGPMTGVVNQLSDQEEEDIVAMASYLVSLQDRPAAEDQVKSAVDAARSRELSPGRPSARAVTDPALQRGEAVFARACVSCHRAGAVSGAQPVPLALTAPVSSPDPGSLVRVVLEGIKPPKGTPDKSMPAFPSLSDDDLVDLSVFVRSRFSQQAAWSDVRQAVSSARSGTRH